MARPNYYDVGYQAGPQTAYKYRVIFSRGFIMGGYKSSAPWRTVNRHYNKTDTNYNLGDLLTNSCSYVDGACSPTTGYALGCHGLTSGNHGNSTRVEAISFATETMLTYDADRDMKTGRAGFDASQSEEYFWVTGGASASTDKFQFVTDTMYAASTAGTSTQNMLDGGAVEDNVLSHKGYFHDDGVTTGSILTYAVDTWVDWGSLSGGLASYCTKGLETKEDSAFGYFIAIHGSSRNITKVTFATSSAPAVSVPSTQPSSIGSYQSETMNCTGQNNGRMIAGYNGLQNNMSLKINFVTDTCTRETSLDAIGHDGASSGAPAQSP
jgi:hypothetical protein